MSNLLLYNLEPSDNCFNFENPCKHHCKLSFLNTTTLQITTEYVTMSFETIVSNHCWAVLDSDHRKHFYKLRSFVPLNNSDYYKFLFETQKTH